MRAICGITMSRNRSVSKHMRSKTVPPLTATTGGHRTPPLTDLLHTHTSESRAAGNHRNQLRGNRMATIAAHHSCTAVITLGPDSSKQKEVGPKTDLNRAAEGHPEAGAAVRICLGAPLLATTASAPWPEAPRIRPALVRPTPARGVGARSTSAAARSSRPSAVRRGRMCRCR